MKVFLKPVGLHSRAMVRVENALTQYAPTCIEVVRRPEEADFSVLHAIGPGLYHGMDQNQPHAIIQYCIKSAGYDFDTWGSIWNRSELVWSYYDLSQYSNGHFFNFYRAPLGVDKCFTWFGTQEQYRDIGVLSSGFVSGPCSEAIEEVALAASKNGMNVMHLGPYNVEGMNEKPSGWEAISDITDAQLASLYLRAQYVSGLRHIEGFELPVLEGLMCGARPIVFDREDMRYWYDDHATFVKECEGEELIDLLSGVLKTAPRTVDAVERRQVAAKFDWETIATGFWERLL